MDAKELQAKLEEDLGEAVEPGLAEKLAAWQAPAPRPEQTARLLAVLKSARPVSRSRAQPQDRSTRNIGFAWLLVRAQLRVVRGDIWMASALVLAVGTAVTLTMTNPAAAPEALPFVLLAPVTAAVGVAFLYGPANDPAVELELATPASMRFILLARLALLYGFNLLLGLVASLLLAAARSGLSLWPLVLTWLAPMTCLSALAFLVSMLSTDPSAGMLLSLLLWATQILRQFPAAPMLTLLPDLLSAPVRPWLWLAALALAGLALWIGGRQERWLMTDSD